MKKPQRSPGVEQLGRAPEADDARQDGAGAHVVAGQADAVEEDGYPAATPSTVQLKCRGTHSAASMTPPLATILHRPRTGRGEGDNHGEAPFDGSFQPEGELEAFEGKSLQGDWKLRITDTTTNGNSGTLLCWQLKIVKERR